MVEHTECSKPSRTSQAIICIKSEIICQNVAAFSTPVGNLTIQYQKIYLVSKRIKKIRNIN